VTKCAVLISTTESDKGLHVYYIPTCPHLQDHHNYYCYYYYSFDNIEEWLGYHIQYNKLPVCAFTTPAIARYSTTTVRDTSIRVPQNRNTQVQYFGAATPLLPRALPTATTTYTTYRPTLRAPAGQLDICGPRESSLRCTVRRRADLLKDARMAHRALHLCGEQQGQFCKFN
jgi:hypothetical protein